jgi:predicted dehydrogenase
VFCPQQARELRALAHERRRNFIVDFIHLWQPPYLQFKQYQSGNTKFRDITLIGKNYGPFRRDYSALWDYAPHDIALALDIMGEYPYSIEIFRTIAHRDDRNAGLYEIVLKFDNGIAHIETGNLSPTRRRFYEIRLHENYQGATNEAGRFSFEDERQFAPLKIMLARFIEKCDNKERWDNLDLSAQVTDVMVLLEKITQK